MSEPSADCVRSFPTMTPDELRKEADRRELVERHRVRAERTAARNELVGAIVAIPSEVVNAASASSLLRALLGAIFKAESDEPGITNGEVSRVSFGVPENWWLDAIADHPKQDRDSLLRQFERRGLDWRPAQIDGSGA